MKGVAKIFDSILDLLQDLRIVSAITRVTSETMYSLGAMKHAVSHFKWTGAMACSRKLGKKRKKEKTRCTSYYSVVHCSSQAQEQHRQLAKRAPATSRELGCPRRQTERRKRRDSFHRSCYHAKKSTYSTATAAPGAFASDRLMRNSAESSTYVRVTQMMFNMAIGSDETR